jgi:dipeptidyl aminopeptidase/acylaminoacyl peptidase
VTRNGVPLPWAASRADEALPAWSPDGRQIAFWRADPGAIWIADREGGNRRLLAPSFARVGITGNKLYPFAQAVVAASWSPDGSSIAFTGPDSSVRVVDVQSGVERRLADGHSPVYSPDGSRIAFVREGHAGVWVIGPDGSGQKVVAATARVARDTPIAWSPDSRSVAFTAAEPVRGGKAPIVATADIETGATTVLFRGRSSAWSPGGGRIAFVTADGLAVGRISTGAVDLLTDHEGGDYAPAWSPMGGMLAFVGPKTTFTTTQISSTQIYLADADERAVSSLTGGCNVTPSSPFGLVCTEEGGPSVPLASADEPLAVQTHVAVNRRFWSRDWVCGCLSMRVLLRDARAYRVREAPVSFRTEPQGMLRPGLRERVPRRTQTPGNARFVLIPTRALRRLRPRTVTIVVRAGPVEKRVVARLPQR